MAGLFDFPRDEQAWADLPPLVPMGTSEAERDAILEEIVAAWATPIDGATDDTGGAASSGVTLNRVALYDAERQETIDLGDLIRRVETLRTEQMVRDTESSTAEHTVISVRGCRIQSCRCAGLRMDSRIELLACAIGDDATFRGATFRRDADFWWTTFGRGADFCGARFANKASFERVSLGYGAGFEGATFGDGADFVGANFGGGASFRTAIFGAHPRWSGVDAHAIDVRDMVFAQETHGRLTRWWLNRWRSLTWATIRAVSELQILTRVSYIALVLVPILAGTWPAVRTLVNRYNEAVRDASSTFEHAAAALHEAGADLDAAIQTRSPPAIGETASPSDAGTQALQTARSTLEQVEQTGRHWIEQYGPPALEQRDLPDVLAWSFFAALFVAIGHLMYQIRAPELIRPRSRAEHAREKVLSFDEESGERNLRLRQAMVRLADAERDMPWERSQNFVHRDGETMWIPSVLGQFWFTPYEAYETNPDDPPREMDPTLMRIAIEEGAKAEYDVEARHNRGWSIACAAFYLAAAILIASIIYTQSGAIMREAGWIARPVAPASVPTSPSAKPTN